MVPRITAVQFHRFMSSGRTRPALCGCEDAAGRRVDDYVVKLRGGMERGGSGLLCELFASLLAAYFGIAVPDAALVTIEPEFAELIGMAEPGSADRMKRSVGLNFGSRLLSGVAPWPVDKKIPEAMWQAAVDIFAFDALTQNPDRRFGNQNLFTRGDTIFAYDHELAFSFLLEILPAAAPWKLDNDAYLADHVFHAQLRAKPIDLSEFARALAALPGSALDGILSELPPEWNNGEGEEIERRLRAVAEHAEEFAEQVKRKLT
jgi:hypothetical protein